MANEKDTLTKAFIERPDVFADAFNFLMYDGRQVIKPQELETMDTASILCRLVWTESRLPFRKSEMCSSNG